VLAHVKYPGFQESKSHSPVLKHTQAHGISDALFFCDGYMIYSTVFSLVLNYISEKTMQFH
jgi:hypothetical protein